MQIRLKGEPRNLRSRDTQEEPQVCLDVAASELMQSSQSHVLLPTAPQNQAETRAAQLVSEVTLMMWLQIQLSGRWLPEFQMQASKKGHPHV